MQFDHQEINTVIGEKAKDDNIHLTIVNRKKRYTTVLKAIAKTALGTTDTLNKVRNYQVEQFRQVFNSITCNNGSEFADFSTIETKTKANTKIFFF